MPRSPGRRRLLTIVAAVWLLAVLLACGGSSEVIVDDPPPPICGDTGRPYMPPAPGQVAPPVQQGGMLVGTNPHQVPVSEQPPAGTEVQPANPNPGPQPLKPEGFTAGGER